MLYRNYRYFQVLAEERSITKAAKRLHVTQPALSKYVKQLEQYLGVSLIDRSVTPLNLTEAGTKYLEFLKRLSASENKLLNDLVDDDSYLSGVIRFGINPWEAECSLGVIMHSFWAHYPKIRIVLSSLDAVSLQNMLLANQIDLCLAPWPGTDPRLRKQLVQSQPVVAAIHRDSPILDGLPKTTAGAYPRLPLERVAGQTVLLPKANQTLHRRVKNFLDEKGLAYAIKEGDSLSTLINMAACNIGIAFVYDPRNNIPKYKELAFFSVDEALFTNLELLHLSTQELSRQARLLYDHILKVYRRM